MTETIRGDVVRLLLDVDTSTVGGYGSGGLAAVYQAHLNARRYGGRQLTEDEAAAVSTATIAELAYAKHLVSLHKQAHEAAAADFERMQWLMGWHSYGMDPATVTVGEFLASIPADEQAEFEMLMDRVKGYPSEDTVHFDDYRRALAELDS